MRDFYYRKVHEIESIDSQKYWQNPCIVEPKFDGNWGRIEIDEANNVSFYSSTGNPKIIPIGHPIDISNSTLIGELGIGTNAALKMQAKLGGPFITLFDVIKLRGTSLEESTLEVRKQQLESIRASLPERWFIAEFKALKDLDTLFASQEEGVVIKPLNQRYFESTWWKIKKQTTYDYVILDIELSDAKTKSSEPMAAALVLGLYVDGTLMPLTKCAGMTFEWCKEFAQNKELYVGKVCEVKAYAQFDTGALRHPSFIRLRDDKNPEDCIL